MSRLLLLLLSLYCTSVLCASPFDALSTSPIASSIVLNDQSIASSLAIDDKNNIIQHHAHTQAATTTHREKTLATMDSEENAFVTLINNYRASNGLSPLILSVTITNAAEWMAKDMAEKNYFSHTDSLNRDPFVRMEAFGYPQQGYRGENIAAGNALASATFDQWKNSPGHNANMLNGNFRIMGIARYYLAGSTYRWYWVNNFGSVINPSDVLP